MSNYFKFTRNILNTNFFCDLRFYDFYKENIIVSMIRNNVMKANILKCTNKDKRCSLLVRFLCLVVVTSLGRFCVAPSCHSTGLIFVTTLRQQEIRDVLDKFFSSLFLWEHPWNNNCRSLLKYHSLEHHVSSVMAITFHDISWRSVLFTTFAHRWRLKH